MSTFMKVFLVFNLIALGWACKVRISESTAKADDQIGKYWFAKLDCQRTSGRTSGGEGVSHLDIKFYDNQLNESGSTNLARVTSTDSGACQKLLNSVGDMINLYKGPKLFRVCSYDRSKLVLISSLKNQHHEIREESHGSGTSCVESAIASNLSSK